MNRSDVSDLVWHLLAVFPGGDRESFRALDAYFQTARPVDWCSSTLTISKLSAPMTARNLGRAICVSNLLAFVATSSGEDRSHRPRRRYLRALRRVRVSLGHERTARVAFIL